MRPSSIAAIGSSAICLLTLLIVACTDNQRARTFGGSARTELPTCRKLVIATWKEDDLWVLTRQMQPADKAELYWFSEDSSFGMLEGEVVMSESRDETCPAKEGGS